MNKDNMYICSVCGTSMMYCELKAYKGLRDGKPYCIYCGGEELDTGIYDLDYIEKAAWEPEFVPNILKTIVIPYGKFDQEKYEKAQARRKKAIEESRASDPRYAPKCPTCGSIHLRKISSFSKAGSVALWGIFSQKVRKQFHCNNCGYEW